MHEVLVNRLGGLSLPRKSVVRLTDRPDMTLDVYPGRKTTMQQQQIISRTQTRACRQGEGFGGIFSLPVQMYRKSYCATPGIGVDVGGISISKTLKVLH